MWNLMQKQEKVKECIYKFDYSQFFPRFVNGLQSMDFDWVNLSHVWIVLCSFSLGFGKKLKRFIWNIGEELSSKSDKYKRYLDSCCCYCLRWATAATAQISLTFACSQLIWIFKQLFFYYFWISAISTHRPEYYNNFIWCFEWNHKLVRLLLLWKISHRKFRENGRQHVWLQLAKLFHWPSKIGNQQAPICYDSLKMVVLNLETFF